MNPIPKSTHRASNREPNAMRTLRGHPVVYWPNTCPDADCGAPREFVFLPETHRRCTRPGCGRTVHAAQFLRHAA